MALCALYARSPGDPKGLRVTLEGASLGFESRASHIFSDMAANVEKYLRQEELSVKQAKADASRREQGALNPTCGFRNIRQEPE